MSTDSHAVDVSATAERGETMTGEDGMRVVVDLDLPEAVVEECRDEDGEIDPDEVSDRLILRPTHDGEPV